MKLIKKLNPLHPILPAICLLIAFAWVGYDNFFREKYNEEEKATFVEGTKNIEYLSSMCYYLPDKLDYYVRREDYYSSYCLEDVSIELDSTKNKLEQLNQRLGNENFTKDYLRKHQEIRVTSTFEKYIGEAIKIDELLKERYQDFILENNLSNQEINELYFSHDTLQNNYHLARFKSQLAKLYYDDIHFLYQEKIINFGIAKMSNYSLKPYLSLIYYPNTKNPLVNIELNYYFPFDTTITQIHSPKGIKAKFNERGFMIIPPELRNKRNIKIKINCSKSTRIF